MGNLLIIIHDYPKSIIYFFLYNRHSYLVASEEASTVKEEIERFQKYAEEEVIRLKNESREQIVSMEKERDKQMEYFQKQINDLQIEKESLLATQKEERKVKRVENQLDRIENKIKRAKDQSIRKIDRFVHDMNRRENHLMWKVDTFKKVCFYAEEQIKKALESDDTGKIYYFLFISLLLLFSLSQTFQSQSRVINMFIKKCRP